MIASHLYCATCAATTLHTASGCAHHPRQRQTRPQPKAKRGYVQQHLGRPRATDLTAAERRVATLFATGLTHKQVAAQLQMHHSSVSNALRRACVRIGAEKPYELVRYIRGMA